MGLFMWFERKQDGFWGEEECGNFCGSDSVTEELQGGHEGHDSGIGHFL